MVRKIKHKKGMEKKPLIIAAVALVAVVILVVLLFFGQQFVGRAYFIPGDTFVKYQAGSEESLQFPLTAGKIIPVKVGANIASKESVAISFQIEYSTEHFEVVDVVPGLDDWGTNYLRTSTPSTGKSTSFNRILFEHATFDYEKAISGSVHLADVNFRVLQDIEDPTNIDKLIQFESIDVLEMSEDSENLILSRVHVTGEMPTCVSEVCDDGIDNDCDKAIDCADSDCKTDSACISEVIEEPVCTDNDNDGYFTTENCGKFNVIDCNDNHPAINPGTTEVCNDKLDNNCNGEIDEGCGTEVVGCTDKDGDRYCQEEDCNDFDPRINPGVDEICENKVDDDCDGKIDEDCAPEVDYCTDNDGDGYHGGSHQGSTCEPQDCNDNDPLINSGAKEICNGIDDNCNSEVDEGCIIAVEECTQAYGGVNCADPNCEGELRLDSVNGDYICQTNEAGFCDNGVDDDWDGTDSVDCDDPDCANDPACTDSICTDKDGDGFGIYGQNEGCIYEKLDCNDLNSLINPGANEICENSLDDNCNEEIDEDCEVLTVTLLGDSNGDGCIKMSELMNFITSWKLGEVGMSDLMNVIGSWKNPVEEC
jgi:hypothetical protein